MPYKFKCRDCKEFVYIDVLEELRTNYKCQHCDIGNEMTAKQAEKHFKIEKINKEEYDLFLKGDWEKLKSKTKVELETNVEENIKNYPSLKFLSGVANFIAWFGVITSMFGGLIYLGSDAVKYSPVLITIMTYVGLTLFTFILFVFWRAVSEILILFVDIAQDIRKTRLKG